MNRVLILALAVIWSSSNVYCQEAGTDLIVGKSYVLNSNVLGEAREIQVYLPEGYDTTTVKTYPVLYILDGQHYFLHGVAYQNSLRFRDKTPPFIVVGINTDTRKRRILFYEDSQKFISFLKDEVIPFVDGNFRTKKAAERMYFGWEMAGGLGLELVGEYTELFSGYFLAGTTHSGRRREAVIQLRNDANRKQPYLLFVIAPEETWTARDTVFMANFDGENAKPQRWRYGVLDREDHYTTPGKAIHEGLADYFHDYKPIRYYTLKGYDDFGGLEALAAYYQTRGLRYDLPTDIHRETKHFLLLNAVKEENYQRFQEYVDEFDGYLESYTRPLWFDRFARFYLANDNTERARHLFETGLEQFPESSLLHFGLGESYQQTGKVSKAKKSYQMAIKIAGENEEKNLGKYQEALDSL